VRAILDSLLAEDHRKGLRVWLAVALTFSAIPPLIALRQGLAGDFIVQDDARQFVFWMYRWLDPALFRNDLIADYFQSASPLLYKVVLWLAVQGGIEPFLATLLLPVLISIATGYYAYRIGYALERRAFAGLLAAFLVIFFGWLTDFSIGNGLPRAFALPALLAFVSYLQTRNMIGVAAAGAVLGLTYPQGALIAIGLAGLAMLHWTNRGPRIRNPLGEGHVEAVGGVVTAVSLLPFVFATSAYGPTISLAAARASAQFQPGGRNEFFVPDALQFYLCGERTGLLPVEWGCGQAFRVYLPAAPYIALGLLAVVILVLLWLLLRDRNADASRVAAKAVIAGIVLFVLAHLLLFMLHLPARYSQHSLRGIVLIALGAAAAAGLARLWRPGEQSGRAGMRGGIVAGATAVVVVGFFALPFALPYIPNANYVRGQHPGLYRYLRTTAPGAVIATLSSEADNIPSFAHRSVLTGREYLLPYSRGYYRRLAARTRALIDAYYDHDPAGLRTLLEQWRITHLVVADDAFTVAHVRDSWWAAMFPQAGKRALASLRTSPPAFTMLSETCTVKRLPGFRIVGAGCLRDRIASGIGRANPLYARAMDGTLRTRAGQGRSR
jgi:hypothetical protein